MLFAIQVIIIAQVNAEAVVGKAYQIIRSIPAVKTDVH